MARVMQCSETGTELTILNWIILKNGWEYYVYEPPNAEGYGKALVYGFETECGSFNINEMHGHIMCQSNNFDEVAPGIGWTWL